ncbi:MAG: TonB-dependent receptor, partial [Calditrichota bacterium]
KGYASRYRSDNLLTFQQDGRLLDDENFDQQYRQAEAQLDIVLSPKNWIKLGSGYIGESVEADRIEGDKQSNSTRFAFAQYEWLPWEKFNAVAGARFDSHSDYGEAFSPKLALLYKLNDNYRFRAGVGSGFKAPNFSQLYLNFTNTLVGYSVFGATSAIERLDELVTLGQIQETLIAPETIQDIGAENSVAYNVSIDASPLSFLNAKVNFFRNDVQDLIDVQAIARKTNNQSVFTYFNLNRVYTTGIESEVSFRFNSGIKFELGYQYIQAKDKDVIEQLENGEIFKVGTSGRIRAVLPSEYGGLFRRPRNSGTVKLSYRRANGFAANVRTVLRGKSGLFDLNGNGILDDESEYSDPYALVNMNVNLPIAGNFTLGAGIENMFDFVDVQSFAGAPGRLIYSSIRYSWAQ